jgi:hypothetical protein
VAAVVGCLGCWSRAAAPWGHPTASRLKTYVARRTPLDAGGDQMLLHRMDSYQSHFCRSEIGLKYCFAASAFLHHQASVLDGHQHAFGPAADLGDGFQATVGDLDTNLGTLGRQLYGDL